MGGVLALEGAQVVVEERGIERWADRSARRSARTSLSAFLRLKTEATTKSSVPMEKLSKPPRAKAGVRSLPSSAIGSGIFC